ncbi:hypothetical protein BS47DRAFT_1337522 [Hydnum rufescens UP504]|uniref:C2H2-type domain-containing protein n=1 Tax=Hydnum rufescens UP504 TaxID=1448309 RepID=A0A9P6B849_9AGAM|nr:hypothetical protein BS47DRAFT_1337522 [Hydnum rufescens UP504]
MCNTCDGSFTRAHDLKRHQRSHSGDRAFVCRTCSSSFTRKDVLKRHIYRYGCNADRELNEELRSQRRREARTALKAVYEAELCGKTMTPEHIDAIIAASVAIAGLSSIATIPSPDTEMRNASLTTTPMLS